MLSVLSRVNNLLSKVHVYFLYFLVKKFFHLFTNPSSPFLLFSSQAPLNTPHPCLFLSIEQPNVGFIEHWSETEDIQRDTCKREMKSVS